MLLVARRLLLAVCLCLAGPALAQGAAPGKGPLVLAAASLQESLTAAANAWTAAGHARPVVAFAASSALARQVEAGAPADLFISADEHWMDELASKGLIVPRTRVSFLTSSLVLIAPRTNSLCIPIGPGFPLARMLGSGRLAMGDPDGVPAGRYGKVALEKLGVWASVASRIAPAESVRGALALVERGQAPFGIVYATDAKASAKVRIVGTFPADSHPPIRYPVALLKTATSPQADAFRRFLISSAGKAIFVRYGFTAR